MGLTTCRDIGPHVRALRQTSLDEANESKALARAANRELAVLVLALFLTLYRT